MLAWLGLVGISAAIGAACGFAFRGKRALFLGALLPWLGLLALLLFYEFFMPYEGGGASMWPIAQLVGGTIAAFAGLVAAAITRRVRGRAAAV